MQRVLAGIRPTGSLHLGNYFGAVLGAVSLQDAGLECFYMVADAHALTTPYDEKSLADHSRSIIIDYLASGLDPEKSTLFLQSMVPEHLELAFYLSSFVSIARMQHLPTFKDKVKQHPQHASMALLNYPILMSADILAYKAHLVPVGIDQEPHLEVAREISRKLNSMYQLDFPEPQRFITKGEYIPSLLGSGKMSKSVEGSYINLSDDLATIKKRLSSAPSDSGKGQILIKEDLSKVDTQPFKTSNTSSKTQGRLSASSSSKTQSHRSSSYNSTTQPNPSASKKASAKSYLDHLTKKESQGVANLMMLVELFQGQEKREEYEALYQSSGIRYGELKASLSEEIYESLLPFREKRQALIADQSYVDQVIRQGATKARQFARENLDEVKAKMGFSTSFGNH